MTSALYIQTRKEVRALLPWWLGITLATVAMSFIATPDAGFPNFRYDQLAWLVILYAAGVLVLAALSVGQEVTHGTFASLLVQPVDRRRVLWTKVGVLAFALCSLGIFAEATFPKSPLPASVALWPLSIWGPVALGIGLVPLFTLLTRKPLAGPVFAPVIPGLIFVVAERFFFAGGTSGLTVAWYATLVVSAIGFAALTFVFPRVEVVGDGHGSSSTRSAPTDTPAAAYVAAPARGKARHWVWQSMLKELRLQQLTFAVSGLFMLLGMVVVFAQRMDPPYTGPGIAALVVLHGVFVAMIAGSRASAEERHLGVLAAQTLQPRAAWQQWVLKVGVTLSVVMVLAIALPWLFKLLDADRIWVRTPHSSLMMTRTGNWFGIESEYFAGVALACLAAMYVSSLSSNSLWALLSCMPAAGVIMVVTAFLQPSLLNFRRAMWRKMYAITPAMQESFRDPGWKTFSTNLRIFETVQNNILAVVTGFFTLLVLYLAYRNHKTLERGARRIGIQAGMMAAGLAVAIATYVGACHLAWAIIAE